MYLERDKYFADRPVVEFILGGPLPDLTKTTVFLVRDDPNEDYGPDSFKGKRLNEGREVPFLLKHVGSNRIEALAIGMLNGETSDDLYTVPSLVEHQDQLQSLRHLFLGNIAQEESELSWIVYGNITDLLASYPKLETLKIRGSFSVKAFPERLPALKSLVIESVGISADEINALCACHFPELTHLELWLGVEYRDGLSDVTALAPLRSGKTVPKLTSLAFCNSDLTDEIAVFFQDAPVLEQLDHFSLKYGTLSDKGAEALLANKALSGIKSLDFSHHYLHPKKMALLQEQFPQAVLGEPEEADYYKDQDGTETVDRYIAIEE